MRSAICLCQADDVTWPVRLSLRAGNTNCRSHVHLFKPTHPSRDQSLEATALGSKMLPCCQVHPLFVRLGMEPVPWLRKHRVSEKSPLCLPNSRTKVGTIYLQDNVRKSIDHQTLGLGSWEGQCPPPKLESNSTIHAGCSSEQITVFNVVALSEHITYNHPLDLTVCDPK